MVSRVPRLLFDHVHPALAHKFNSFEMILVDRAQKIVNRAITTRDFAIGCYFVRYTFSIRCVAQMIACLVDVVLIGNVFLLLPIDRSKPKNQFAFIMCYDTVNTPHFVPAHQAMQLKHHAL